MGKGGKGEEGSKRMGVDLTSSGENRRSCFGHLACSAPEEDHHHVITAALQPPTDWRRPVGRP